MDLVVNSGMDLNDIAAAHPVRLLRDETGFSSQSHFTTTFRNITHMAPSAFGGRGADKGSSPSEGTPPMTSAESQSLACCWRVYRCWHSMIGCSARMLARTM
jgi:hypothetical protein